MWPNSFLRIWSQLKLQLSLTFCSTNRPLATKSNQGQICHKSYLPKKFYNIDNRTWTRLFKSSVWRPGWLCDKKVWRNDKLWPKHFKARILGTLEKVLPQSPKAISSQRQISRLEEFLEYQNFGIFLKKKYHQNSIVKVPRHFVNSAFRQTTK